MTLRADSALFCTNVVGARGSFEHGARPALNVGDQRADLLGRTGRVLRQFAHFVGDDGETAAVFAGARGFDRGVEREQVGLVGDFFDQSENLADLARGVIEALHLGNDVFDGVADGAHAFGEREHFVAPFAHLLIGNVRFGANAFGVARDLHDRGGHLLRIRNGLFDDGCEVEQVLIHLLNRRGHLCDALEISETRRATASALSATDAGRAGEIVPNS